MSVPEASLWRIRIAWVPCRLLVALAVLSPGDKHGTAIFTE